jgi:hypothetical protein
MSYEECAKHGCEATNGCPQCLAEEQAACSHHVVQCTSCGKQIERPRVVTPLGTTQNLVERLRLFPPDTLAAIIGHRGSVLQVCTVAEAIQTFENGGEIVDSLTVRVLSSSRIWPE